MAKLPQRGVEKTPHGGGEVTHPPWRGGFPGDLPPGDPPRGSPGGGPQSGDLFFRCFLCFFVVFFTYFLPLWVKNFTPQGGGTPPPKLISINFIPPELISDN